MTTIKENKNIVSGFIQGIWNENQFENLNNYLHPDFEDFSLPPALPANQEGLKTWIRETSKAFEHKTIIEDIVAEADKVVIKLKLELRHIGTWRTIEPTGSQVITNGYRFFKLREGKILNQWALIDGTAIENQLTAAAHGCKIQP